MNRLPNFVGMIFLTCLLLPLTVCNTAQAGEGVGSSQGMMHIQAKDEQVSFWKDITVKKDEKFETIVVMLGDVEFHGEADEMVVLGGSVHLYPGSRVNDELVVLGGRVTRDEGAYVGGESVNIHPFAGAEVGNKVMEWLDEDVGSGVRGVTRFVTSWPVRIMGRLAFLGILFGFALLLFYFFPKLTADSQAYMVSHLPHSFAWGILAFVAVVPCALLLIVSVVGIPVTPLFLILFGVVVFGGMAVAASEFGKRLPVLNLKDKEAWALLVGILLLGVLAWIPFLGHVILWVFVLTGTGAVIKVVLDRLTAKKGARA